jgi:hypothetical protein
VRLGFYRAVFDLKQYSNVCLREVYANIATSAFGRVATVVGTTRRLNEQVRRRRPLALAERGAIQAATSCTCRSLLSARVRKLVANDLPHLLGCDRLFGGA